MNKVFNFIKRHKQFTIFSALAIAVIVIAIIAPLIVPYNPFETNMKMPEQAPSSEHLFGTDKLGRDEFSRILYGARTSLSSSFILVGIVMGVGTLLGVLAGYFGGFIETIIMRFSDIMISFPDIVFAIAIAGILGGSMVNAIIAIAAVSWTRYARLSRSLVLKIKNRDYVKEAKLLGSSTGHILFKYMFKVTLPTMIITATTDIGSMIMNIAALSFLGFGAQPPTAEWGLMLNEGRLYMFNSPWLMIFPGIAIFVVVMIFNLLGDSLRDLLSDKS